MTDPNNQISKFFGIMVGKILILEFAMEYICRVAMYLNVTWMHYDHSQYVTHLAQTQKLKDILKEYILAKLFRC